MSREVLRKRRVGTVDPNLLYTTEALMELCRMKRKAIVEMRQGGVKPAKIGPQMYYDGAEVKAWILNQRKN